MIQRITKYSIIVIITATVLSLVFASRLFALNVFIGGAMSILSFRGIAWAVRKFLGHPMAQAIVMGFSALKIFFFFVVLALLGYFGLIHGLGFIVGFTAVLAIIIKEGFLAGRRAAKAEQ